MHSLGNFAFVVQEKRFMSTFLTLSALKKIAEKLLAATVLASVLGAFPMGQPAHAQSDSLTVTLDVYGTPTRGALGRQAESAAVDEITKTFTQNPQLASVKINVLGHLNGRVAPIFSLDVSREQWLSNRQLALQAAQYYYSSYVLLGLEPGGGEGTQDAVAQAPREYQDPAVLVQQAADEGRISQEEYYELIDALD